MPLISVNDGSEFASKALGGWALRHGIHLGCIRAGRPMENGCIESFSGRLRNESLNVEGGTLKNRRAKLERWRHNSNLARLQTAIFDQPPAWFLAPALLSRRI
jgi:putative transposase